MSIIYGDKCKLGYGYDDDFGYIMPFECQPLNVTKEKRSNSYCVVSIKSPHNCRYFISNSQCYFGLSMMIITPTLAIAKINITIHIFCKN